MFVWELNRDELVELKQHYLAESLWETEDREPSYGEYADADEIISDGTIFEAYEGYSFVKEDFFCNCE